MEWDLKMPAWDLADSHQENEEQGGRIVDCSVDLKLGGFGDFGLSNQWKDQRFRASASMVTSSGSSRRARVTNSSGGQIAACLVDDCVADLSKCREYHKRHKVCEAHSKTRIVVVGGVEQRFCQQCSRFHSLSEFDEGKRSCRKRLDGHNRRRRKPQQDTLNTGTLLTNHQGTRYSSFHQICPTSMPDSHWINFSAKSEHGRTLHSPCLPFQFPFLQPSEAALGSDRAFSLLSSSSQSSHINPTSMPCNSTKISSSDQHLYPCFHSSASASMAEMQMDDENVGSNLVSEVDATNLHWQWYPSSSSDNII